MIPHWNLRPPLLDQARSNSNRVGICRRGERLLPFFQDGSYEQIQEKLETARGEGMDILPPAPDILKAYDTLSPDQVKVVILGQDPYPTPGHAHGLQFQCAGSCEAFSPFTEQYLQGTGSGSGHRKAGDR